MSLLFSIERAGGGTLTATIKLPERNNGIRLARKQSIARTAANIRYSQDHGISDTFLDMRWEFLDGEQYAQLVRFFEPDGANMGERAFSLVVTGAKMFATGLNSDQVLGGEVWNSDQGFNSGDIVFPATVNLPRVFLEEPEMNFDEPADAHFNIGLRFWIDTSIPEVT